MNDSVSSTAGKGPQQSAEHKASLERCRTPLLDYCRQRFTVLLDQANSALLDFAERAESNTVQGRFFEAISHLHHHRDGILRTFLQEVALGFDAFGHVTPPPQQQPTDAAPELSLIAPDEMEESVACENIIIKANANCFPELYALSQRLAAVNGGVKIKDYEIIGGPHQLVHALRTALRALDVDVKVKIVLYALFDKLLMRDMQSVYRQMNQLLKDDGVLPHIKPVSVKKAREREIRERAAQEARAEGEGADGPRDDSGDLFTNIIELMSKRRGGANGNAAQSPIPRAQVVSAFDKLPAKDPPGPVEATGNGEMQMDERFVGRVKAALEDEREQVLDALDRDKLAPVDADLIDLIGLLFEYMLNDPVLPNSAKALISHLHTPYLKLALIDRRLLVNSDHAARRLLDNMVEAGSLWMEETHPNRGIYPHIQRVVDRVLQEFSDDVSLFDELLAYFDAAVAEQRKRTDNMERRTTEAARGRERLQLARQRAAKEVQALTQSHTLPPPLRSFMRQTWLDLLAFILLRNEKGEDSEAWADAIDIARQLVELFDPALEEEELQKRLPGLPGLRARIQNAVRGLGSHNHTTMEQLNTLLEDPGGWRNRAGRDDGTRDGTLDSGTPSSYMRAIVDDSDETDLDEEERVMVERLRKTKFGTWFELRGEDGGTLKRVKLSWMSLLTSTCMFVDRAGMQAEVKTLRELAREMLSGEARVIPKQQHPFIERALVSIRKALSQEDETGATAAPPGATMAGSGSAGADERLEDDAVDHGPAPTPP